MARKTSSILTEAEQRVMAVLWSKGDATVRDVADALNRDREVAYTTVQTILTILEKKKYVASRKDGRAFVYHATVSKREAQAEALKSLVTRFFDGSPKALAQYLVDEADADLFTVDELRRLLEEETGEEGHDA